MSKTKLDPLADYEWVISLSRSSLKLIGVWPVEEEDKKERFFAKSRATMSLTIFIFCLIPCMFDLIRQCDSVVMVVNNFAYSIPLIITIMKFSVMLYKKEVLSPLVNMVAEDWAKSKLDSERNVMIRRARIGRSINVAGFILAVFTILLIVLLPRFGISIQFVKNGTDPKEVLPLPSYFFYDVHKTPLFEILYVTQIFGIVIVINCYIGVDNLVGMLVLHISGQLENLRVHLLNIKKSETFNHLLAAIVERHIQLISAIDVIESTFTLLLFLLLMYCGLITCVYGLLIITIFHEKEQISVVRAAFFLSIIINAFAQMCLYCIAGQLLLSEAEGIFDAAYECEWTSLDPKKSKSLIFLMVRANKPVYLTAGKILPMTVPTLCNILRISFSYMSFLLTKIQ